jgi:peptidoglycan DL-endopeptidase LytE
MEGWAVFVTALAGLIAAVAGLIQALYPGGIRGLVGHGSTGRDAIPEPPRATASSRLLRTGLRGRDVMQWQRSLNDAGVSSLDWDGIFGRDTAQATKQFQKSHGLVADGIVGPDTRAEMQRLLRERLLGPGSQGSAVAVWQHQLNQIMHAELDEDGLWGPDTRRTTLAFQKLHGLALDGLVGAATRQAMREAITRRREATGRDNG